MADLTSKIQLLSEAPDGQIDEVTTKILKKYLEGEVTLEGNIRVLRNCLDNCVMFFHGSRFAIMVIRMCLEPYPKEPDDERKERQMEANPEYFGPMYEAKA